MNTNDEQSQTAGSAEPPVKLTIDNFMVSYHDNLEAAREEAAHFLAENPEFDLNSIFAEYDGNDYRLNAGIGDEKVGAWYSVPRRK